MTDRRPTTRRVETAQRDIQQIRADLDWLETHLPDIDIIGHTNPHRDTEHVTTSHPKAIHSPDLTDTGQPKVRDRVRNTCRQLEHTARTVTALRVGLETTLAGPGADPELIGTTLEPGELDRLRGARDRRVANEGDARWGEWEAQTAQQPGQQFRGGRAS